MQISVIIIAKNEEENLSKSLPNLTWCNEIILIDDFSTDNTAQIASMYGCKIFQRKLDNFGKQKQFAVAQTSNNWVLNLDADEILSDALIDELKSLPKADDISGYELPIRNVFLNRIFKYGKESNFYHLRLFNKQKGNFDDAIVHEKIVLSGITQKLKNVVFHHSYKNIEHYITKLNHYSSIGAKKLFALGRKKSLILIILSFPIYFIKHYFFYGNILNGKEGFIWSYLNAWYHTIKYLKLRQMYIKQ